VTGVDADGPIPGYWSSPWPGECGGPRRQKLSAAPGLDLRPDEQLVSTVRHTGAGRWPVMFVRREEGELFLQGSHHGSRADGWLERVDPVTLEPVAASSMLPSGGHSWCGAVAVHENGDLYMVNGRYVHRLDRDCRVIAERELPLDAPHNGLVVLPDGNLVTKILDLDTGQEKGRAPLGAPAGYGMFFCPGFHRDLYAVSLLGPVTRVALAGAPTGCLGGGQRGGR
jgi:hypothetical protein